MGAGVYFARGNYVGLARRVVIILVDLAMLYGLYGALVILFVTLTVGFNSTFFLIYVICAWLYLTVFKASRIRTVGYWLTGSRVVDLQGRRPSVFRMTFRLLLWLLGPFNLVFDLLWSGIDEDRQTLRDRFAGTCVINHSAEPIGTADIHLMHYNALGLTLMYPRVMRPEDSESESPTEPDEAT